MYLGLSCIMRAISNYVSCIPITAPSANNYYNNYSFSNVELKLVDETIKQLTKLTITDNKSM